MTSQAQGENAAPRAVPEDSLGAFCRDNHVALRGSGHGLLAGLRFGAKDHFHVAGTRTGFGQPDRLRTHAPPEETAEVWHNYGVWVSATRPRLGPGIKERFASAARVTPEQVAKARDRRSTLKRRMDDILTSGSILCLPTSPRIAPLKNTATDTLEIEYRHQAMSLLCIAGLCGLPQITPPLAKMQQMPLGLSLIGPRGADEALLQLTCRIMAAVGCEGP